MHFHAFWKGFLKEKKCLSPTLTEPVLQDRLDEYFDLLAEERGRSRQRGIYRFYCMLGYAISAGDQQRGLDDILADLRALPNVTIVSVVVGNKRINPMSYVAGLSIKYIPSTPGTFNDPHDVKKRILLGIKRTKNVQRVYRVSARLERLE